MSVESILDIQHTKKLIKTRKPPFLTKIFWLGYFTTFFIELLMFEGLVENTSKKTVKTKNEYSKVAKSLTVHIKYLSVFKVLEEKGHLFYYFTSSFIVLFLLLATTSDYLRKRRSKDSNEIYLIIFRASNRIREFIFRNFEFMMLMITCYVVKCTLWKESLLSYKISSLTQRSQGQVEITAVDLSEGVYEEKLGKHSLFSKNLRVNSISFFAVGGLNFISIYLLLILVVKEAKRASILPLEVQLCSRRGSIWLMRAYTILVLVVLWIETKLIKRNFLVTLMVFNIIFSAIVSIFLILKSNKFNKAITKNYLKLVISF